MQDVLMRKKMIIVHPLDTIPATLRRIIKWNFHRAKEFCALSKSVKRFIPCLLIET